MTENELLKKIAIAKAKPQELTDLKPKELVDLVLIVLDYVKKVHLSIENGRIKGDKGDNGQTPLPDIDYLSYDSGKQYIESLLKEAISKAEQDINKAVSQIRNGKDGKDGKDGTDAVITKEQLEEVSKMAIALIELPDFASLITQEPEAIRNSLELLQGDERLDVSAIKGLEDFITEIKSHSKKDMAVGGIRFMSALLDVAITNIQNNQVLAWNSTTNKFENVDPSGNWDSPIGDATFTYDVNGNVDTKTVGATVLTFSYDVNGNVDTITDGTHTKTFSYDVNGNLETIIYT